MSALKVGVPTAIYVVAVSIFGMAVAAITGAPSEGLIVQGLILTVGAYVVLFKDNVPLMNRGFARWSAVFLAASAAACLLIGPDIDGVRRWLGIGPYLIQPVIIGAPVWAWLNARLEGDVWTAAALSITAILVALQPDAAAAAALAGGLLIVAVLRRGRADIIAASVAICALVWAATRPDPLPPVPYVELAAETAIGLNPILGVVAWAVLLTLPLPFLLWRRGDLANLALAASWAGLVGAAVLGNYPQPMIGYGASLAIAWIGSVEFASRARARTPQESA